MQESQGTQWVSDESLPEFKIYAEKLPSRGIYYPHNVEIKYRGYTYGEVKKASISKVRVVDTLKDALQGVFVDNMDKFNLTVNDALYIAIARKISTFGSMKIKLPYSCGKCGELNETIFSESDIVFRDLSAEITEFPICTEMKGKELEIAPTTVRDFITLYDGRYDGLFPDKKPNVVSVQATWIKNMDYEKAYKLIFSLTEPEDIELIEYLDKLLGHDIEPIHATCSSCNHENKIRLEGKEQLLAPFRDGEESNRSRVRFGKKSVHLSDPLRQNGVQPSNDAEQSANQIFR